MAEELVTGAGYFSKAETQLSSLANSLGSNQQRLRRYISDINRGRWIIIASGSPVTHDSQPISLLDKSYLRRVSLCCGTLLPSLLHGMAWGTLDVLHHFVASVSKIAHFRHVLMRGNLVFMTP